MEKQIKINKTISEKIKCTGIDFSTLTSGNETHFENSFLSILPQIIRINKKISLLKCLSN